MDGLEHVYFLSCPKKHVTFFILYKKKKSFGIFSCAQVKSFINGCKIIGHVTPRVSDVIGASNSNNGNEICETWHFRQKSFL